MSVMPFCLQNGILLFLIPQEKKKKAGCACTQMLACRCLSLAATWQNGEVGGAKKTVFARQKPRKFKLFKGAM